MKPNLFGKFPGDHKTFKSWKWKFIAEHKSKKQEAHRSLMKECGGTGKQGDIPPTEYFPDDMKVFKFAETIMRIGMKSQKKLKSWKRQSVKMK